VADLYMSLDYRQYKALEKQLGRFKELETTHESMDKRFYHRAFRLDLGEIVLEFQGPRVMAPSVPSVEDEPPGDE